MINETICAKEKEKQNGVRYLDFLEEHELQILPPIHETSMICTIDGDSFFALQKIPLLEIQVHYVISQMMTPGCMISLRLKNFCKAA